MHKNIKITSIILAGGKSSRFGTNKALEKINNIPIIEYVYNSIKPFSDEILISCNTDDFNFLPAKKVKDKISDIGPIGGIYSSLLESTNEKNLIVSCDTPLLSTEFFTYLLGNSLNFDVSNPIHNTITEPVIGIFNKQIITIIERNIRQGITAPPKIFKQTKHQFININLSHPFFHEEMFRSINTKADFNMIKKIFSGLS